MNTKGKAIKVIIISLYLLVPALLTYLGQNNSFFNYLQNNRIISLETERIPVIKDILLIAGIFLTIVPSGIKLVRLEWDNKYYLEQRDFLIKYVKDMFMEAFESKVDKKFIDLNIRIFVPIYKRNVERKKRTRLFSLPFCISKRVLFKIKNIKGLSDPGTTNDLEFEVYPKIQGIVGRCYNIKTVYVDEDIKSNNENYNLTEYQKSKTCDVEFCLCVPIFGKDSNVIAIMSLDSTRPMPIPSKNRGELYNILYNFSKSFNEQLPELFK